MIKGIKEKIIGASGSATGVTSLLGSWQVCHNVCLALVAFLGLIGISVIGMPLEFLTKFAMPLWIIAVLLLLIIIAFYFKNKCISKNQIMFNSGLIIAGIPFKEVQQFTNFFWIIGGILVSISSYRFITKKMTERKNRKNINKTNNVKMTNSEFEKKTCCQGDKNEREI